MSTKPAFSTKSHPENSVETKTYKLVESLKEFIIKLFVTAVNPDVKTENTDLLDSSRINR